MSNTVNTGNKLCARNKKNVVALGLWTGVWLVTLAIATFGPKFIWSSDTTFSAIAIAVNLIIGAGMIVANKKYLYGLDEMQQKIQLDAMALSLGVGMVCGFSYSLLDITNVISSDAEISFLLMLMGLTYSFGTFIGKRRYQ